jgi:hypothetical protein
MTKSDGDELPAGVASCASVVWLDVGLDFDADVVLIDDDVVDDAVLLLVSLVCVTTVELGTTTPLVGEEPPPVKVVTPVETIDVVGVATLFVIGVVDETIESDALQRKQLVTTPSFQHLFFLFCLPAKQDESVDFLIPRVLNQRDSIAFGEHVGRREIDIDRDVADLAPTTAFGLRSASVVAVDRNEAAGDVVERFDALHTDARVRIVDAQRCAVQQLAKLDFKHDDARRRTRCFVKLPRLRRLSTIEANTSDATAAYLAAIRCFTIGTIQHLSTANKSRSESIPHKERPNNFAPHIHLPTCCQID